MIATNGHDHSFSPIAIFLFAGLGLRMTGGAVGARVVVETSGPPTASAARCFAAGPPLTGIHLPVSALTPDVQATPD